MTEIFTISKCLVSHPFWKHSHLKNNRLPEIAFSDSDERTGVLCMNELMRA